MYETLSRAKGVSIFAYEIMVLFKKLCMPHLQGGAAQLLHGCRCSMYVQAKIPLCVGFGR